MNKSSVRGNAGLEIDNVRIDEMLREKEKIKEFLRVCAACGACSESCFVYRQRRRAEVTPAAKADRTLGRLFRHRGGLTPEILRDVEKAAFADCLLCRRCYCPMGIDIPGMIAFARSICRSQGLDGRSHAGEEEGGES